MRGRDAVGDGQAEARALGPGGEERLAHAGEALALARGRWLSAQRGVRVVAAPPPYRHASPGRYR